MRAFYSELVVQTDLLRRCFVQHFLNQLQIHSPKSIQMTDLGSFHLSPAVGLDLPETGVNIQSAQ